MTFRPKAFLAWWMSYAVAYAGIVALIFSCATSSSRVLAVAALLAISMLLAIGASLTDGHDERPVSLGLTTWALGIVGTIAAPILLLGVAIGVMVTFVLAIARRPVPDWGVGVVVCGVAVVAWFWGVALLGDPIGDLYRPYGPGSEFIGAGVVSSAGAAAAHTLPNWRSETAAAMVRGLLVAAALGSTAMLAILACS